MNQAAQRPAAICGSTRHLQTAKGHLQAANTDNNGISADINGISTDINGISTDRKAGNPIIYRFSADRNGDRGPEGGYKSLPGEAA